MAMAKHAFKMLDAEMHVMEPIDLWERYIDHRFKSRTPRRLNGILFRVIFALWTFDTV